MEWISVEDGLPILETDSFESYETVELITYDGEFVESDEFCAGRSPGFWSTFKRCDVTHWMLLPEPPA